MSALDIELMNAVSFGNPVKVEAVLRRGANPHVQNDGAMVLAISTFNPEMIRLLFKYRVIGHQYPEDIIKYLTKNHMIKMIQ